MLNSPRMAANQSSQIWYARTSFISRDQPVLQSRPHNNEVESYIDGDESKIYTASLYLNFTVNFYKDCSRFSTSHRFSQQERNQSMARSFRQHGE